MPPGLVVLEAKVQGMATKVVPLGPIEFGQAGAAAQFAEERSARVESFVPDEVRACWTTGDGLPLRCNRDTGKIEHISSANPREPSLIRRISSAGEIVRRAISFVFDEESRGKRLSRTSGRDSAVSGRSIGEEEIASENSLRDALP